MSNSEHNYSIAISTLKAKIVLRSQFLAQKQQGNTIFAEKVRVEARKTYFLLFLIKRFESAEQRLLQATRVNSVSRGRIRLNIISRFIRRYMQELSPPLRLEINDDVNRHFAICPSCSSYLRSIKKIIKTFPLI